jgi:hypothetical protein
VVSQERRGGSIGGWMLCWGVVLLWESGGRMEGLRLERVKVVLVNIVGK